MPIVGIQGERGSACDAVAGLLIADKKAELAYLASADSVLSNLKSGRIDLAVLASESPVGTPVSETVEAISKHGPLEELRRMESEVRHVILVRPGVDPRKIQFVASHPIPLAKHRNSLSEYFPGYSEVHTIDTGVAAQELADGKFPENTAAIAMPHAANIFGLQILDLVLPANDNYLTRFVLVRRC